ncbi:NAD(P)-binding protein [Tothia fuscella]|uniref:NAD(P)-binding protein n=1 Tax=Tothia fuscella TaxID=1048955 RepID=A0A9P4NXK9_9PEZI|nr:NAD(P)-binding protein [Tothia fuscella]
MDAAVKLFFSAKQFAVVGASSDPTKFGHKVFVWYLQHKLPVTPLNPKSSEVTVGKQNYVTASSPAALPSPSETSLSIITPPKVTLSVLKEAKVAGVLAVWLQPGSFDNEVAAFAKKEFKAAIYGFEGNTVGAEGWCVLVDGENGLHRAGREWERQRL